MENLIYLLISFLLSAILVVSLIPLLKRLKYGQSIRLEGPQSHLAKAGVPTMGGLAFLLSTAIITAVLTTTTDNEAPLFLLLFVLVSFGLIGFIDDYIIVVKKDNKGLTSKQKLLFQILVATIFYFLSNGLDLYELSNSISIPILDVVLPLGFIYYLFIVFWLVGFSNAVNLTDGVDGLATTLTIIALIFLGLIANHQQSAEIVAFCFILIGSLLGFLLFNKNKAKIIMGDTGSLALGGVLAAISILLKQELLLLLIGIVFVCVTMSVIIQVYSVKRRGKKVFRMTPLHHHFELLGWSDWKIVGTFSLCGFVGGLLALYIALFM